MTLKGSHRDQQEAAQMDIEVKVRSEVVVSDCSLDWTLKDFSGCQVPFGGHLTSEIFPSDVDGGTRWQLRLYPRGLQNLGWLEVSLKKSSGESNVFARCKMWLVTPEVAEGFHFFRVNVSRAFDRRSRIEHVFLKFANRDLLLKRLARAEDDTVRLCCEMQVTQLKTVFRRLGRKSPRAVACGLATDVGAMLASGEFADAVLKTGDRSFRVHQAILSCRAPNLYHELKSKGHLVAGDIRQCVVDLESDVLERVLKFVYSNKHAETTPPEMAPALFRASVRYGLPGLGRPCTQPLLDNLTADNVCEILGLSEISGNTKLKVASLDFLKSHFEQVRELKGWRDLKAKMPRLAMEVSTMVQRHVFVSYQ